MTDPQATAEAAIDGAIQRLATATYKATTALELEIEGLNNPATSEQERYVLSNEYMSHRGEVLRLCREVLTGWNELQELESNGNGTND